MLQDLKFSSNWNNKLECKCFTTIRPFRADRYRIGEFVRVVLNGKFLFNAEIVHFYPLNLSQISETLAHVDTGYNAADCCDIIRKMYKLKPDQDMKLMVITAKRIKS